MSAEKPLHNVCDKTRVPVDQPWLTLKVIDDNEWDVWSDNGENGGVKFVAEEIGEPREKPAPYSDSPRISHETTKTRTRDPTVEGECSNHWATERDKLQYIS